MKNETIKDKLVRKTFESAAIQKSWQIHAQAFGPILNPAFVDNYQARITLTDALNCVAKRDIEKGIKKLRLIEKACSTDEDKAAWLFCMGLCFEMANVKEGMLNYYQEAGEYEHKFYLPYLKVAKAAHNDSVFEVAESNYIKAIQCIESDEIDAQKKIVLGSVYTNYASCLTMMHRYNEADRALEKSKEVLPEQKGRVVTEAILEAAKRNVEKANCLLDSVKVDMPASYDLTKKMVTEVIEERHPHFNRIKIAEESITAFWDWFVENENCLLEKLEANDYRVVFDMIQPRLKEIFTFMERDPELGIEPRDSIYKIIFADFFVVSLECGYKDLIESMPRTLAEHWEFDITH